MYCLLIRNKFKYVQVNFQLLAKTRFVIQQMHKVGLWHIYANICYLSSTLPIIYYLSTYLSFYLSNNLTSISWLNNVKPLLAIGICKDTQSSIFNQRQGKIILLINKYFMVWIPRGVVFFFSFFILLANFRWSIKSVNRIKLLKIVNIAF